MMNNLKLYINITLLSLITLLGCSPSKQDKAQVAENADAPTADIKRIRLADLEGNEMTTADFKGKVVFLNFWATWCKPCIAEMPSIERAMKKLEGKDVVFLAASDEDTDRIEKFIQKYPYSFQYIRMLDDYEALGIYSLPTTIIYDRNGDVVVNEAGARDWDADDMIEKMESL